VEQRLTHNAFVRGLEFREKQLDQVYPRDVEENITSGL